MLRNAEKMKSVHELNFGEKKSWKQNGRSLKKFTFIKFRGSQKKTAIFQVFVFAGDLIKNYKSTNKKKPNTKDKSFVSFPWKSFYMKKNLLEIFMLFHPFVQVKVPERFRFACFGDTPILSFCLQV